MTGKAGFIPHPECMVASGECFRLSKCLGGCRDRAFYQHQTDLKALRQETDLKALRQEIAKLEIRILKLEPPNAK